MNTSWASTSYSIDSSLSTIPVSAIAYAPVSSPSLITEVEREGKRWYVCDNVYYPSITTLLSATDTEGNTALRSWRNAIGHAAATQITQTAAARGVQWHTFCEQFVMGQTPHWTLLTQPSDVSYAANIGTVLNERVSSVLGSEMRVVSRSYGVAGRVDLCVTLRDGRRAIVDFKTGKKQKSGNRLNNYAMQATFYADAVSEVLSSPPIDTIVIVQLLADKLVWQESSPALWRTALTDRIASYATLLNEQLG